MKTLTPLHDHDQLYLYYLQLEDSLTSDYMRLAARFKNYNITLVPVHFSELDYFVSSQQIPLIVLTDTSERYRRLNNYRSQYLDFVLRNQGLYLFHLNSFGRLKNIVNYEKSGYYTAIPLPVSIDSIVQELIDKYFTRKIKEKRWPGGKRVRPRSMRGQS